MSDFYTPFVQDLLKEAAVVIVILGVAFFIWKLARPNG